MADIEVLNHIPLFAGLAPEERAGLAGMMHERHYARGAIIFNEGDPGDVAYFVHTGRVKVYRVSSGGNEQIMGLFGPGQPFGLVVTLDGSPYPASAVAVEDARVWYIRSDDLRTLMIREPRLAGGVMREIGERLRRSQSRVHSLAAQSVHQRLASYLLDLATTQDANDAQPKAGWQGVPSQVPTGRVQIRMTMTHQELGGYLGASRETVTRALADLRRRGAVSFGANDTLIIHLEQLREFLEG